MTENTKEFYGMKILQSLSKSLSDASFSAASKQSSQFFPSYLRRFEEGSIR